MKNNATERRLATGYRRGFGSVDIEAALLRVKEKNARRAE